MICYCDGKPHEFALKSDKDGVKTYDCPKCKRTIAETTGEPVE